MPARIKPTIGFANQLLQEVVQPGDVVVDATAGNGNDTLFLARLVGKSGSVHAFDIQEQALANTRERLRESGLAGRVALHLAGHEQMLQVLPAALHGAVRAVMFNLGFLPQGRVIPTDPDLVVTRPETTVPALDAALELLAPGGVITSICYAGHDKGREELEAVQGWCESRDSEQCRVLHYEVVNKAANPIRLYCIEKKG